MKKIPRLGALFDYTSTIMLTAAASVVTIATVATLARVLDEDSFLDFSLVQRYFGFLAIVVNLAVGFAFIKVSKGTDSANTLAVARLCRNTITVWSLLVLVAWAIYVFTFDGFAVSSPAVLIVIFVWVITQGHFHLSAPYSRHLGGVKKYLRLFTVAKIISAIVGLWAAYVSGFYWTFFLGYAAVSYAYQFQLWSGNRIAVDLKNLTQIWQFSSTRWFEGMLRAALPLVFVILSQAQFGHKTAGYVAVIYTFVKSIESVLQPLVISIMMRSSSVSRKFRDILVSIGFSVVLSLVIFVSQSPVEFLFGLLLGEKYLHLTQYVWMILFSMGPIISLNILRALHDNEYSNSPLLLINCVCVIAVVIGIRFCNNLQDISLFIILIQVLRWCGYMLFLCLRPANKVSLPEKPTSQ